MCLNNYQFGATMVNIIYPNISKSINNVPQQLPIWGNNEDLTWPDQHDHRIIYITHLYIFNTNYKWQYNI